MAKNWASAGIRAIIAGKGLVQKVVANRAGFTEQQFCDMLNGRKLIRTEYLPPIATALGVSLNEIYDAGKEERP